MENNLNKMNEELQSVNVDEVTNDVVVENTTEDVMEISEAPVKQPKKKKLKGLGDVVKVVTNAIGIETCDDCEQRRLKLNKMFPFTKTAKRELTESEIELINGIGNTLTAEIRVALGEIAEEVLGGKVRHCSCPSMYKGLIDRLRIQIEYQNIK